MKTKSHYVLTPIFLALLLVVASPATVPAGPNAGINPVNPQTGLPMPPIDPTTGLPADGSPPFTDANGVPTWIDPNWKDSFKMSPEVKYDGVPLDAVANMLRDQSDNAFDIILPQSANGHGDPGSYQVHLQMKHVKTAAELFSAMNMEFELDKVPWRWELTVNGSRQAALLRFLPELAPPMAPQKRIVVYVGNLLQSMKIEQISDAIDYAWHVSGLGSGTVQSYPAGSLLIVSGTPDQADLAQQTLSALNTGADKDLEKTVEKLKILNDLNSNGPAPALAKPQPAK